LNKFSRSRLCFFISAEIPTIDVFPAVTVDVVISVTVALDAPLAKVV
jgi:hypothetical protein